MKNVCDGSHENCPTCNAVSAVNRAERETHVCFWGGGRRELEGSREDCPTCSAVGHPFDSGWKADSESYRPDCPDFDDCAKARVIAENYKLVMERNVELEALVARIDKAKAKITAMGEAEYGENATKPDRWYRLFGYFVWNLYEGDSPKRELK